MAELGRTLHAWRDRLSPADAGFPAAGVRRAPGLRREELAQLAGLSVDYVVRLEQGRSAAPSVQVLNALARALRLTDGERDHLFALAGQSAPAPGRISSYVPPGVQRLVDQLGDVPLSVHDAAWTLISCNPMWAALLGDPSGRRQRERNLLWCQYVAPDHHGLPEFSRVAQTEEQARRFLAAMITDLRAATARYPGDPTLFALIDELRAGSRTFADAWDRRVTGFHESDRKTVHHPELGAMTLDCTVLNAPGSDLRLVVYTAVPGSEDAEKLRLLSVLGLQSLTQP